jgi:hypothetical protein
MAQLYPGYDCEQVTIVASRIPDTIVAFGRTRHTALSLRLFVPNGLTEYNSPFLPDVSVAQSSRWWFSSCSRCSSMVNPRGGCSPAVPAAPSLRPVVSSGPLMRRGFFRVAIYYYFF